MRTRRTFLADTLAAVTMARAGTTAAFAALPLLTGRLGAATPGQGPGAAAGFGPLIKDPAGILDLPAGFSYRVISRFGDAMSDGLVTPGAMDAMAAFAGATPGTTILVRNHELDADHAISAFAKGLGNFDKSKLYDAGSAKPASGGTTTLHYDHATQQVKSSFLSLGGTMRNCAGGPTPWGSWLTCEESVARTGRGFVRDHGFVFEVPAAATTAVAGVPLLGLGRFNHEAAAVDAADGAVYLSEDRDNGLLYRFVPNQRTRLAAGGRLQALVAPGADADTSNGKTASWTPGKDVSVRWLDLDSIDSPNDDLRLRGAAAGAAIFLRGEGLWTGSDGVYLCCTSGGKAGKGQIFRIAPGGTQIRLHYESPDAGALNNGDNLSVAPFGHLIIAEDPVGSKAAPRLIGITPNGQPYILASNAGNKSEFAGVCFSPDGSTLFANIQNPGTTLAITGPWPKS